MSVDQSNEKSPNSLKGDEPHISSNNQKTSDGEPQTKKFRWASGSQGQQQQGASQSGAVASSTSSSLGTNISSSSTPQTRWTRMGTTPSGLISTLVGGGATPSQQFMGVNNSGIGGEGNISSLISGGGSTPIRLQRRSGFGNITPLATSVLASNGTVGSVYSSSTSSNIQTPSMSNWSNTPNAVGDISSSLLMMGGSRTNMMMNSSGTLMGAITPSALSAATPSFGATPVIGATPTMNALGGFSVSGVNAWNTPVARSSFTPLQPQFAQSDAAAAQLLLQKQFIKGKQSGLAFAATSVDIRAKQLEEEYRKKNRYLTDAELDVMLPSVGYDILPPPSFYQPKVLGEPNFYSMAQEEIKLEAQTGVPVRSSYTIPEDMGSGLPTLKPCDAGVFEILLKYHNVSDVDIPADDLSTVLVMRSLLKIKNGDNKQRNQGMRYLLEKVHILGVKILFNCIFELWKANIMGSQEQHFIVKLLQRLLFQLKGAAAPFAHDLIACVQTLLSHADSVIRDDGRDIIAQLSQSVGIEAMFNAIKNDMCDEADSIRRHTAKTIAIIAQSLGTDPVIQVLAMFAKSNSTLVRHTVTRALQEMALFMGANMNMNGVTRILLLLCTDTDSKVRQDAANALSALADAIAPHGYEFFKPLIPVVREHCRKSSGKGRLLTAFLKAFGSLISLMDIADAQRNASEITPSLLLLFNTPDDELRRVILRVVQQCIISNGITPKYIRTDLVDPFFKEFWSVRKAATDRKTALLLMATTLDIARKIGSTEVLDRLVPYLKDDHEPTQTKAVDTVRRVIETCGTLGISPSLTGLLIDGVLSALRMDERGMNKTVLLGVCSVLLGLGRDVKPQIVNITHVLRSRLGSPETEVKAQAAEIVAVTAPAFELCSAYKELQSLFGELVKLLEDEKALPVSFALKALRVVGEIIGPTSWEPPAQELLELKLKPLLKHRDPAVQYYLIEIIQMIALTAIDHVKAIDLLNIAKKDLFNMLDSPRRGTRRVCARAFGTIAYTTSSAMLIVRELIDNLRSEERRSRICTGVALSTIATSCRPFTIIPFLINEYKEVEGIEVAEKVQHGILKSIRFIFEEIGSLGKDYVYVLVPLVERALTESSIQTRRMGVEVARALIMSTVGYNGFEDVVTHLLNYVHPNIAELLSRNQTQPSRERLRMICETVRVFEAARLVLGSAAIFQYLVQGLFHPATKIREVYWRAYNMIYLANPEAMLPCYPSMYINMGKPNTPISVENTKENADEDVLDLMGSDIKLVLARREELYYLI